MFGKYNGFDSKARVSACMYFLVCIQYHTSTHRSTIPSNTAYHTIQITPHHKKNILHHTSPHHKVFHASSHYNIYIIRYKNISYTFMCVTHYTDNAITLNAQLTRAYSIGFAKKRVVHGGSRCVNVP
jgi:hypothetical protein